MFILDTFKIAAGFFKSDERRYAFTLLAGIIVFELFHIYFMIIVNNWYKDFYNSIQAFDITGFYRQIRLLLVIMIFSIFVNISKLFLRL